MGWQVWGEWLKTSDFSGAPIQYQPITLAKDTVLTAVHSWVILFNNPAFSGVALRLYSDRDSKPGELLAESIVIPKAEISLYSHAVKSVPFSFDPKPWLKGGERYHLVLWPRDYVGTESSHLAWKRAFPDPVYSAAIGLEKVGAAPFDLSVVGGRI